MLYDPWFSSFCISVYISLMVPIVRRSISRSAHQAAPPLGVRAALSFPGQSLEVFFTLHLRLHIQPPKLNDLRQHLINGECPKLVKPFIRSIRNALRIRMLRHDVADVLEQLKRKRIQCGVFRIVFINALLQVMKILVNISVELVPVYSWNGSGSLKVTSFLKFLLEHRPSKDMTDEQLAELAPWSEKLQSIKIACEL